jgi:Asp-tRNA(Asn)/Glu-tRNA(Gln) amidotransferase A subunit family amidase
MSVRRLVRSVYGKPSEQRATVEGCIDIARAGAVGAGGKSLSASSSASPLASGVPTASSTSSSTANNNAPGGSATTGSSAMSSSSAKKRSLFTEITNHAEYQALLVPSSGALSGVAVSVSDAIDVRGFQTRYGMTSSLFHRVPREESAFIDWIRKRGAHVVGKLKCTTPLAWEDGVALSPNTAAYAAVQRGASHYAITTTALGAPAMTACYQHDTIGFKPTARSLDTRTCGPATDVHHPLFNRLDSGSIGIVARSVDDIKYLWDVYTGAIQSHNVVASIHEAEMREEIAKKRQQHMQQQATEEHLIDHALKEEHDAFLDRIVGLHGSRNGESQVALTVGFPAEWIARYFGDQFVNASAFEDRVHAVIQRSLREMGKEYRNIKVEIVELPFSAVDVEGSVKAQEHIAEYDLARAFSSSTSSGMMDELPTSVVTALFNGRNVTENQYVAAHRLRQNIVREIDNQFRDVDLICCPVVGEPYVEGNMRSVITTVPFALSGNPTLSARVDDKLALQLVGEMGRDTGLLEDATSLLRFMGKGKAPRWWRQKFLGEVEGN